MEPRGSPAASPPARPCAPPSTRPTYGNGAADATAGIQAAIDALPGGPGRAALGRRLPGQRRAPDHDQQGRSCCAARGRRRRGSRRRAPTANPADPDRRALAARRPAPSNLTANAPKGATSVQVTSAAGFSVGQLVAGRRDHRRLLRLLGHGRRRWRRAARGAAGSPATTAPWARCSRSPPSAATPSPSPRPCTSPSTPPTPRSSPATRSPTARSYAGVEDLYVRGGQDDNITLRLRHVLLGEERRVGLVDGRQHRPSTAASAASLRDSYVHDTPNPYPGGAGYMLSLAEYTADSLVENNIFINGNKVMVMRASGGGNVIGYNYFDNGYIGNYPGWMETGLNASHLALPALRAVRGEPGLQHRRRRHLGRGRLQHLLPQPRDREAALLRRPRQPPRHRPHVRPLLLQLRGQRPGHGEPGSRSLRRLRLRGLLALGGRSRRALAARLHAQRTGTRRRTRAWSTPSTGTANFDYATDCGALGAAASSRRCRARST